MKFVWTTFLLVLLLVSALDAKKRKGRKGGKGRKLSKAAECNPTEGKPRRRIINGNSAERYASSLLGLSSEYFG